jgi:hypothetical protein
MLASWPICSAPDFSPRSTLRRTAYALNERLGIPINPHGESAIPEVGFAEQTIGTSEALVFKTQQTAVLEIRSRHAPATFQVAVYVILDDAPQGIVRCRSCGTSDLWISRVFVELQRQRIEHSAGKLGMRESHCPLRLRCLVQRRTQQGDLCKVVKVAGLK